VSDRIKEWARTRVGRRGAFLLIFALAFAVLGIKAIIEPSVDDGRFVLYSFLPNYIRGVLWITPAAIAVFAACRTPPAKDIYGFVALIIPPTVLAASHLWSWVAHFLGATPYAFGWASAATWVLQIAIIVIAAGVEDMKPATRPLRSIEET